MYLLMNIIVLLLEVIYYSLFMKFARKEGDFYKYLINFSLITIIGIFIGTSTVISYFSLILMIVLGLKYIVKIKTSVYDILVVFIMLLIKIAIEGISFLLIYNLVNNFVFTIIIDIIKISFVLINRNNIKIYYIKLKSLWDNNNFFVRYIFNILLFVFIIMSFVFIIIK